MDKQRLILEEFLTKRLKYSSQWHPTVLKYRVVDQTPIIFQRNDLYFEEMANLLLNGVTVYNLRNTKPYVSNSKWVLGQEFNYWAEQSIPLIMLHTKGSVVNECIPNVAIGPFLKSKKSTEWWVQYLLDGNNFLTK